MRDFVHLHTHGEFSQLDGIGTGERYATEAEAKGFKALALTDHANVDGVVKHQQACNAHNIQPIIGCEMYIVKDVTIKSRGERRQHLTFLVQNQEGWENILKMLTIANTQGFYRRPRVDPSIVKDHHAGLVAMSGCASTLLSTDWGKELFIFLSTRIPSFGEVMAHGMDDQTAANALCVSLAKSHNVPLVATHDCHYPAPGDSKAQETLLAIQRQARWDDPDRWRFDIDDLYLKTYREMYRSFSKQGQLSTKQIVGALDITNEIASLCKFNIAQMEVNLPKVPGYEDVDEKKLLVQMSRRGFKQRVKTWVKDPAKIREYKDRMTEELGLIIELGFERYFLIVWELIAWCRDNDIMTGPGRGSVGGCLVAYLLYITDVDPIHHGLIFSRFISPARIDLPDIDMDFEDIKRDRIRAHLEECYGKYNVCGVSTFMRMKGRSSIRDVSRVFDVPFADVDACAKSIVVRSGGDFRANFTIEDALETFEDGIKFKRKYPEVTEIAMNLEGQVRGSGQHAAAMCISSDDLRTGKRCNLAMRNGVVVANWDKYDSEYMGMMKLDVLGLSALTVLNQARKLIQAGGGEYIDFDALPLDDPAVYKEISAGNTVGAFQIGSFGLSQYCKELKPKTFEEVVHATALWRPGTLRSGMTHEFVMRKNGQKWKGIHPLVDKLTKDTYGIILYQEQVMWFMYDLGGLGWRTCDTIRKVISKSQGDELFMKFKGLFVEGCVERKTLDAKTAGRVWDSLSSFGSYGFNKSHAVEYSLITYWDMWLKVHHTAEFMAASLTYGSADKKDEYVEECRRLGLEIELPKVGISNAVEWSTKDGKLFVPFIEVKGIGEKVAEQIADKSKVRVSRGFFGDGISYTGNRKPNKTVMAKLEGMLAFSEEPVPESMAEELNPLFTFDISKDKMRAVRGIYERIKKSGKLGVLSTFDYSKPSKDRTWLLGSMIEVKFGYRKNIMKQRHSGGLGDIEGTGESLGGVYGFFKDESAAIMLVFAGDVYNDQKDKVEHCQGEWILIQVDHPTKNSNIFAHKVYFQEDLLSCDIDGAGLDLIEPAKTLDWSMDWDCNCGGKDTSPYKFETGNKNIMIVTEFPLTKEVYKFMCGELERCGLSKKQYHLTQVVKCFDKDRKKIKTCSDRWLVRELTDLEPVAVLSFGNVGLQFFANQQSGIRDVTGTTVWNREYNCWVTRSISPGMSRFGENRDVFREAIGSFVSTIKSIGWRK